MKKIFSIMLLLAMILQSPLAIAHPGRTDSSGCHTCRTNCASRGLSSGQYHCHSSNTQTNVTSTRNTTIGTTYGVTVTKDSLCNSKYPGTVYRASDDKCICLNGNEWNSSTRSCFISTGYNQISTATTATDTSLQNTQCGIKYPGTIYRASDDTCVCENGREWNAITRSCKTEYEINTEKCDMKFSGTVYRASDDQCVCPGNNPYGWSFESKSCN